MANINPQEANSVIASMGFMASLFKKEEYKPIKKGTFAYSLTQLDNTVSSLANALKDIYDVLKKAGDVKATQDRKQMYAAEEASMESEDKLKPELPFLKRKELSVENLTSSPLMKAAIATAAYQLLPEDVKNQIKFVTRGILNGLGVTNEQIAKFEHAVKMAGTVILGLGALNIASMVVPALAALATGFAAFCKRFNVTPPKQLALIAGGAVLAREALGAIDREVNEWAADIQKQIDAAKMEKPGISGTSSRVGATPISMNMSDERLKEIIAVGESGGRYDVVYGNGRFGTPETQVGKTLTEMTVAEVMDYQQRYLIPATRGQIGQGDLGTGAVGKYQIVYGTLKSLVDKGVVSPNEKFSPTVQEKAGSALVADVRKRSRSDAELSENINKVWTGANTTFGPSLDAAQQTEDALSAVNASVSSLQNSLQNGPETKVGRDLNRQSQENNSPPRKPVSNNTPVVVSNNTSNVDNKAVETRAQQVARAVNSPHGPDMPVDR